MQCQYGTCTNIGVHSCASCGKLVCGMHAPIAGSYPICTSCWRERQQVKQMQEKASDKITSKGCLVFVIGAAALVLAAVLSGGLSMYGFPALLGMAGTATAIIGGIILFVGIMKHPYP